MELHWFAKFQEGESTAGFWPCAQGYLCFVSQKMANIKSKKKSDFINALCQVDYLD